MFTKVYDRVKNFISENYKQIVILVIFLIVMNYPLDYTVMVSGGTINVNDRVTIENETKSKGSYNLAYVTELRGTIPSVALSYIIPSWKRVPLEDYQVSDKETTEDIEKRNKIMLKYSFQASVKVAYLKSENEFKLNSKELSVVYVDTQAETDVKVGDIIKKINDKNINTREEYKNVVNSYSIGSELNLEVIRDDKIVDAKIKVKEIDSEKLTGLSLLEIYNYDTTPSIKTNFKNNESGPSGGLMLAISIYDKLVSEDLTSGLKIVGTGTIDYDGNVGEIDGVEYKLRGAVKEKADIFIAPTGKNYNECIKLKEKEGYNIDIIEAKTFNQVIEKLRNYKK